MDDILDELEKLNRQLEDYFMEGDSENQEGFNKLVMIEFKDPKLREALILMHSKYMAEMEAIRKYHFKWLNKIVHINKNGYKKIIDIRKELLELLEKSDKRDVTVSKIFVTSISLVFILGSLFYMFTIDKEAGKMIADIIKSGFSIILNNTDSN